MHMFLSCVCACMSAHTHMQACGCGGQRSDLTVFFNFSPCYSLKYGLSFNLELNSSAIQDGQ